VAPFPAAINIVDMNDTKPLPAQARMLPAKLDQLAGEPRLQHDELTRIVGLSLAALRSIQIG
jgi:hypothetical protein